MTKARAVNTQPTPDFQAIFQSAPGHCLVLSTDFIILAASDMYLSATMTAREEIVGHYVFDIFPDNPDDPNANGVCNLRTSLEKVLKTGETDYMPTQKYDIRRPKAQGGGYEERYWSPCNVPVKSRDGNVEYIIHCVKEMTEIVNMTQHGKAQDKEVAEIAQKLYIANKELSESRAFLKNIINTVVDPIFVKDRQHRWIEGNNALWALFGKSEKELLGKSDYDFFPKDEADVFWQKDEEVFNSGQVNINIENFTDASGKTHIISTKKSCFIAPNGEQILVGVIRDITELREMEAKLKQSDEARLRAIMDHSGRPVYIKDLEGRFIQINSELISLMEIKEEEAVGKSCSDFFPKEYADVLRKNDLLVVEQQSAIEFEEKVPHRDGTIHTYTSVKFPLFDANGKIYAICGISTDITPRKEVEAKLLHYTWQLERSNQELNDFAYIASHDLKEPLRGLFNHATFLLEDYKDKLDEDGIRRLNRLSQLTRRMEQLINDLLYYSRLGRTELAVRETDPNEIVAEIKQMLDSSMPDHRTNITIPNKMPLIICDKPRITEVFRNLITNAIKYNDKPQRKIEIGFIPEMNTRNGIEKNVFYVKDNGNGIAEEFHQDIFRIFKRLQNASRDKDESTGVGLTFVKKIIERHNGHIWLESIPKEGSTFYFTLGNNPL
jgi:PAS domain S-box-containing protein